MYTRQKVLGGEAVECTKVLSHGVKRSTGTSGAGRREEQAEESTGPAGLSVTRNSLLSLRLLVDVRKDVNFMKSQSELAQKRNDPGREMQNSKTRIHTF